MPYVQSRNQRVAAGANALAYSSANIATHLLVAAVMLESDTATVTTLVDSQANTWVAVASIRHSAGQAFSVQMYYAKNCNAGANTVTMTPSAGASTLVIMEYSGYSTTAPLAQHNETYQTGGTTATSANAITTTDSELLVAVVVANRVITPGVGYTTRETTFFTDWVFVEDRVLGAASAYNATAGLGSPNPSSIICIATFKLPTGYTALTNRWRMAAMVQETPDAFWRLGDQTGLVATDDTLNGYDGTINGGVTLKVDGWPSDGDDAMTFNGTTGYIEVPDNAALSYISRFTIMASFKTTYNVFQVIVNKTVSTSGSGWSLGLNADGSIRTWIYNGNVPVVDTNSGAFTYRDGAWHQVIVTWDGTTTANGFNIYVDGGLVKQATAANLVPGQPAVPVRIGQYSDNTTAPFNGTLDEIALYSYTFTAAQVTRMYTARTATTSRQGLMQSKASVLRADAGRSFFFSFRPIVMLNGIDIMDNILKHTLSATDILSDQPDTVQCTVFVTSPSCRNGYADTVLADGCVGYWRLGELVGVTANDSCELQHPGTYVGGVQLAQVSPLSDNSTGVIFDGSTGYVTIPNTTVLNPVTAITVEVWVKYTLTGYMFFLSKTDSFGYNGYELYVNTGTGQLRWSTYSFVGSLGFDVATTASYNDGNWHHAVGTFDGVTPKIYVDGAFVAQTITKNDGPLVASTSALSLGARLTALLPFAGSLDEVAVYPTALTLTQIARHYALRLSTDALSGWMPQYGNTLILADGASNNRFFGGTIVKTRKQPIKTPGGVQANVFKYDVWATDWTWLLNRRTVSKTYEAGQSSTLVVLDLVASYTTGFTSHGVQPGGPVLDAPLTFRGAKVGTAIQSVATATAPNWNWYVDVDMDVHYFLTETSQRPVALAPGVYNYNTLDYTLDLTQVRTRMIVLGGGGRCSSPTAAGSSSIPVDETSWYSATGGELFSPSEGQVITYTGRSASSGPGNITGVPTSGVGSILDTCQQGEQLNVRVVVDDAAAQAALGLLELDQNFAATDGIHEQFININNGTIAQCTQAALAELSAFKTAVVTGSLWSLDRQMRSGKILSIKLPVRGIVLDVTIQQVTRTFYTASTWQFQVQFGALWRNLIHVLRRLQPTQ